MAIDENIRIIRRIKQLSQIDFAKKLRISQPQLSRYETGVNAPDYQTMRKLDKAFNVNIHWLVTNKGEMFI